MIGYLRGNIINIDKDSVIVDVNNVGYQVITPLPYDYHLNQEVIFYIYTHVKEDQLLLFGFNDLEKKQLFLKLISVNGVGPKTAITILSSIDIDVLIQAIELEQVNTLKKIPGIGPKAAAQIILDLKGKFDLNNIKINNDLNDALEALKALGYKDSEVKKIEKELCKEELNTEQYIKKGLKLLLK
ncbi:MAG: Holliday junction branch migration protein RuvA [Bacilli bacterium]|jgi:Holliday junction DNA helicase RuvA|nr:Holliday junction branch migration protein RuvA [Bacilli bacterium]